MILLKLQHILLNLPISQEFILFLAKFILSLHLYHLGDDETILTISTQPCEKALASANMKTAVILSRRETP